MHVQRMWIEENIPQLKKLRDKQEQKMDIEKIFDHKFKEGKKVRMAPREKKKTAKQLMGMSINRDFKNKSYTSIHPF